MKNKKPNSCVLVLKEQINNSLELLKTLNLVRFYNEIGEEYLKDEDLYRLSWKNHTGGRNVSSNAFLKINQYLEILESGAYHAILFDYSIIRVSFSFSGDELVSQNLLWWPCPVEVDFEDEEFDSFAEIVNLFLQEREYYRMRSPVRIDLDTSNDSPEHPKAHMHIQHPKSRINTEEPICFNTFVKFIINNYYPQISIKDSDFPSTNIRYRSSKRIDYIKKHKLYIHRSY
ncbi:DUF2290 domain-containing protein [Brevibacillus borstelensis]|jgi:hypothetical protein|uniref:DUF2290 domain-containing protein n=1 Tax=Brevibacillus borstelensis TaxID=45462 RepID=UPI00148FE688|nr:DUF2290 domain-containing protein [Brevibacillus borstelensis]MCC0567571.1 DUF2290 domain-containing protein [Brevibacillus borstelensis]MCM3559765.1 DUF2290 domain-containing protein [Brevibacillus borstelensis]MED1853471.1 DUF2290 domain-containing protein [Brevibacillus borstelensis]NOU56050.1 DUF2290 domain-containing protein [Brevibacillus borstelensis]